MARVDLLARGMLQASRCEAGSTELAWDLEDGLWALWVADVDRVRGVVDDDGPVLLRERHQLLQLLPRGRCARGVVGIAEEDQVRGWHLLKHP